jgi:5-methylcytosine-specific restriction enzyme A
MTSWIFQGNPKRFRINKYLLSRKVVLWDIRQEFYASKISIDDVVYIWRSDGKDNAGGIIAIGKIITLPSEFPDNAIKFWMVQHKTPTKLRVKIKLTEVRIDEKSGMLTRSSLAQDPLLSDMKILSYFSQTNYILSDEHAMRLKEIWIDKTKNV